MQIVAIILIKNYSITYLGIVDKTLGTTSKILHTHIKYG